MAVDSGSEGSSSSEEESRSTDASGNGVSHTFACTLCPYSTDRKNNLKRHAQTMHEASATPLECCGVFFASKADLRAHTQGCHSDGYHCEVCGRTFCRKALLKRHFSVHSGYKEFSCRHCSYQTSHKSNLERHMRIHQRSAGGHSRHQTEAVQHEGHLVVVPTRLPVTYYHGPYPVVQAGPQWPMPPSPCQAGPLPPYPSVHTRGPPGMDPQGAIPKVAKRKPCGYSVAELLKKEEDHEPPPASLQQIQDGGWREPPQPAHMVYRPEPIRARDFMHSTYEMYTEAQAYYQPPWSVDAHFQGHYNPPTPPEDLTMPSDRRNWTHGHAAEGENQEVDPSEPAELGVDPSEPAEPEVDPSEPAEPDVDPSEPEYVPKKLRMAKKFKCKEESGEEM